MTTVRGIEGRLFVIFIACLCLAGPAWSAGSQQIPDHATGVASRLKSFGRLNPSQHLRLAISLPLRNQQALTEFLAQLQDPASPNYHKYLSAAQFTEQFGPSENDYAAVIAFAGAHGLNVIAKHPNRLILDVDGTVSDIEKTLHVTFHTYQHPTESRRFFAPDAAPTLELSVPILGISGLDNFSLPRPQLKIEFAGVPGKRAMRARSAVAPDSGSGPYGYYMGNDFRAAYVPSTTLTGAGQTVGLVQFDGYTASDITYYESLTGRPNVTLTNVLVDGATGAPSGDGGEVEVSLDIEMVISMAPGVSSIRVYEAPNTVSTSTWHDILNKIATEDLAKQVSCSWYLPGGAEDPTSDMIFQEMAAQGQSFFTASGDYDAFTGLISFPDDSPYITLVGGTQLTTSGGGAPYGSEAAWNRNNGIGTGGGISTQYAIPTWQQGISMTSNLGSTTMRNVPDVALTAEDVYVRADGEDQGVGGTSCAAPLWAGFTALVNQQAASNGRAAVGFINPAVYSIGKGSGYTAAFHDTIVGNNYSSSSPSKFPAVTGYDLCTGWGSPNGTGLIYALAGQPESLTLSIPTHAPAGTTLLTGTLNVNPTPTSNLTVNLSSGSTGLATVPATVTIPAGQSSVTFPISIIDDGILDGSQPALITAAASGYASGSATILVDDDETATLSVSAPASAIKGSASLQGTVTMSAAPALNVAVSLASNNTNAVTVPASVTVLAGQTSVTFPITVVNDGAFDGGEVATITAHVNNWTDGTAVISVLDNMNLGLTIPVTARKGQGTLSGSVQIDGTMSSSLAVSLASNNLGRVTVPATMTILAGQTSGTFPLTIVDNGIADGTQNAVVTATASGFVGTSGTIAVSDNHPSYFVISNIPNSEVANAPFGVSITAYDSNNTIITTYARTIYLTATGSSGALPVTPVSASGFVNGVWTGNVAIQAIDTNVVLNVSDGLLATGTSNTFNVGYGPLDHFTWSVISSPQQALVPFTATITAQDVGNNTVASYSGTATLTCSSGGSQLSMSPGLAVFSSGVWAGNITIAQTGTGVVLCATDGSGTVSGNIYIADSNNSTIRVMTTTGVVTTLAGTALTTGTVDGTGSAARFGNPYGVAVDAQGNVYVADTANHTIRKVTAGGVVTTIAGGPGVTGTVDGPASAARFDLPYGLCLDGSGNIFIADTYNYTIRMMTPAGVVSTIGGTAGVSGTQGGVGAAAGFLNPQNVIVGQNGTLYVADTHNHRIAKGVPSQNGSQTVYTWSNFAGSPGTAGGTDGTGSGATFYYPSGLALDGSGNLLVVCNDDVIRRVTPGAVVTTLAGTAGITGYGDGTGNAARFDQPYGVALDGSGNAYIVDSANQLIRKMTPATVVTTIAGSPYAQAGTDGTGSAARFSYPNGATSYPGGRSGYSNAFNVTAMASMSVSPAGGFSASGPIGGPFTSSPTAYVISNLGTGAMNWSVSGTASWLTYVPMGGALASGSSMTVSVTVNSAANTLGIGNYADTISFANTINGLGNTARAASLTVTPLPPVITSALNITGTLGAAFSYQIAATNSPTSYGASILPGGLNINTATGLISGNATGTGTSNITITASNAGGTTSANLTIVIVPQPTPVITSALAATGTSGVFFSYQITATNNPTGYNATGLPGGLTVNTSNGLISGTLSGSGTYNVSISASDLSATGSANLAISILVTQPSYFTISNIASPQIAHSAFGVSITAYNANHTVITGYAGTVYLTATGSSGALVLTPTSASGFVNGVWTGNVSVQALDNNVILSVADGLGATGTSNAFTVGFGPLDHFAWATIASPQQALAPFSTTLTAQDAANNTVASYSGTAYLSCSSGTVPLAISSGTTALFSSGTWSGNVAIAQTGTGAVLYATDGSGTVSGNIYIADSNNSTIRVMTTGGVVTTLAGHALSTGTLDGTGSAARFGNPYGLTVDAQGNVYVADTANHTVRKVTAGGVVTTIAGSPGVSGTADGPASAARFDLPYGLCVDGNGNIFVADTLNYTIRMITPGGVVSTIGGKAGVSGTQGGVGAAAGFLYPQNVIVGQNGTLYVADTHNYRIAIGVPSQNGSQTVYTWSNFAGSPGTAGGTDGTGSGATFYYPSGLALDGSGNLLVVCNDDVIRKVTPAAVVTTLAGSAGLIGSSNGTGSAARFNQPYGIALDGSGNAYIADSANQLIRKMTPATAVTTIAGSLYAQAGTDGTGSAARFSYPNGAASYLGGHTGNSNAFNITSTASISVSPAGGLSALGPIGGPFTSLPTVYTISNVGSSPLTWSVSGTSSWLSYGLTGGILASGSGVTVSVTINSAANSLSIGSYGDTMSFVNTISGLGNTTRTASLTVTPLPPVITSALNISGSSGYPFSYTITATHNPTSYEVTALPAGLVLNSVSGLISGTASVAGTTGAIISTSNAGGVGSASLLITIHASYRGWQNQWFSPGQISDPTTSGEGAMPAGDGVSNLLKYAFNLNPWSNCAGRFPAGSIMTIGGTNYLTLTYTLNIFATDLTYIPEVTGDLKTWYSGPAFVLPVSVIPNSDGITESVIVQDSTPVGNAPRFIRLRVIGP